MQNITDDGIERDVIEVVAGISKRAPDNVHKDQTLTAELGLDSIQLLEMLAELEERFGIEFEPDDLRPELFRSVRAVIGCVKIRLRA